MLGGIDDAFHCLYGLLVRLRKAGQQLLRAWMHLGVLTAIGRQLDGLEEQVAQDSLDPQVDVALEVLEHHRLATGSVLGHGMERDQPLPITAPQQFRCGKCQTPFVDHARKDIVAEAKRDPTVGINDAVEGLEDPFIECQNFHSCYLAGLGSERDTAMCEPNGRRSCSPPVR